MLGKEDFLNYMNDLKICIDNQDSLGKALAKMNPDVDNLDYYPINIREEILIVELLTRLLKDETKVLIWFIYDLDWGKKGKRALYDSQTDKYTSIETVDQVYDYIKEINHGE